MNFDVIIFILITVVTVAFVAWDEYYEKRNKHD